MNKRPQRRFETEEEIIKKIDQTRAEVERQKKLCAVLYESSKLSWKRFALTGKYEDKHQAEDFEKRAKAADVKSGQLVDLTCKRLGERLSEFRTQRMPFLEDESIPQ